MRLLAAGEMPSRGRLPRPALSVSVFLLLLSALQAADIPPPPQKAAPGMERGSWAVESWGNAGTAEQAAGGGGMLLKLTCTAGAKDKAVFRHATCFGIAREGKVRLSVYSPDDAPPRAGLILASGAAAQWQESRPVDLKAGWNKFEFLVAAKEWKSEASGWKFAVPVAACDDIRALGIAIYNGNRAAVLYVLDLNYDLDERGEKIAALVKQLRNEDRAQREQAEKELVACGKPATEALLQLGNDERPEVLLRAASVLRDIGTPAEPQPKPKARTDAEKPRDNANLEAARKRADSLLLALDNARRSLSSLRKEAHAEVAQGRALLEKDKDMETEKRKTYVELLEKLEAALKDVPAPPAQ
ncbi:MAG: hypothetical protein NTW87_16250 [Planctomycetota bacterium]|nr:hypothetical protein [Planctomycetota bacterium]